MKNKSIKLMTTLMLVSIVSVGCSQPKDEPIDNSTEQTTSSTNGVETEKVKDHPMQYIEDAELKEKIENKSDDYIILDVRKIEDYQKGHIEGAYAADQDAANKGGDDEKGKENLRAALKEATGNENGNEDDQYALVCYSGKSYAQKATDLMIEMGIPADKIYTLDGGMKSWESKGEDYKKLVK